MTKCVDPVEERVIAGHRFDPDSGCWLWIAFVDDHGYGRLRVKDGERWRLALAHRLTYEMHVGPVPDGLELDHLCRTRRCVNPQHLEPVTHAENMRRAGLAVTHCVNGHEYTPENTRTERKGTRTCRECKRIYMRSYYQRLRAEVQT